MGVSGLWQLLKAEGCVEELAGPGAVAAELEGAVVAVDLSLWIFQAQQVQGLQAAIPDRLARATKVVFERALLMLRHGCVPVGVLEGEARPEKRATQQQRFAARTGRPGGGTGTAEWGFAAACASAGRLFKALGLPVLEAPGEGEALCAALCRAGLASACASGDADALLFGAGTVYRSLQLKAGGPGSEAAVARLGRVPGGAASLVALALLTGGDFDGAGGAAGVGGRTAWQALQHLLRGREVQDGTDPLDVLEEAIDAPADPDVARLTKCTGCRRCKHEGHRANAIKHHTAKNGCGACSSSSGRSRGAGAEACALREGAACSCAFHTRKLHRVAEKVLARVRSDPAFLPRARAARDAYAEEGADALAAAEAWAAAEGRPLHAPLPWLRRPCTAEVRQALAAGSLAWPLEVVRAKLLPLLMDWDLCHPGPEAEWRPTAIQKEQGLAGKEGEAGQRWRYLLRWERTQRGEQQWVARDREWLEGCKDAVQRAARASAVRAHWPRLTREFEAAAAAKAAKEARKGVRGAPAGRAADPRQRTLGTFFRAQPKAATAAAQHGEPAPGGAPRREVGKGKERRAEAGHGLVTGGDPDPPPAGQDPLAPLPATPAGARPQGGALPATACSPGKRQRQPGKGGAGRAPIPSPAPSSRPDFGSPAKGGQAGAAAAASPAKVQRTGQARAAARGRQEGHPASGVGAAKAGAHAEGAGVAASPPGELFTPPLARPQPRAGAEDGGPIAAGARTRGLLDSSSDEDAADEGSPARDSGGLSDGAGLHWAGSEPEEAGEPGVGQEQAVGQLRRGGALRRSLLLDLTTPPPPGQASRKGEAAARSCPLQRDSPCIDLTQS